MINYIIYLIALGSAMIVGLLLKLPLLPESPKRQSWTLSVIFPTAVLALGFAAMLSKLGYFTSSNLDYYIALAVGILTAVFSKFILEKILPPPIKESSEESKTSDESSGKSDESEISEEINGKSPSSEKSSESSDESELREESHG
jgi:energy-converting hydrogenase A subunit A